MKTLVAGAAVILAAGCMLHREPPLPSPIPAITGEKREIEVELEYIDFVRGTGAMVEPRKCIYTHYTGWLTNGTKFDSSRDTMPNGRPRDVFSFNQGLRRVIMGWDMGYEGMRVGGKRRLIIPHQLAYGEAGRPPIPPRATLVFDVELLGLADTLTTAAALAAQPSPGGGRGGPPVAVCPPWDAVKR
ncbi:MAG TPA: FKBP-type peptidyl-prolyl cis-trans isomerase [Gemmatimonadaceae bacterium]|nr:FKBP-type peptidyl-prolyl cis-trans isomerase [Gemmatimonadaceae bacterium]